jgi:molybdate transport system ATP-binding protein
MATTVSLVNVNSNRISEAVLEIGVQGKVQHQASAFELNVHCHLENGITILFGASGAGKTTLLDVIAGLRAPQSGRIAIGDRILFDSEKGINLPVKARNLGYVFQDLALFPHLNVEANVRYGLATRSLEKAEERAESVMASLGILSLRERRPAELSGGERQRVALARALVIRPSILLLDEPLAALDLPVRMKIAEDLRRTIQAEPLPVIYVTHSRDEVFMLGEKLLILERGKLIAHGTPHEVMSAPRTETVAQLAGFENIFDAQVSATHPDRGTMSCRIGSQGVELETPLVRAEAGSRMRVGISAGDVLLAASQPSGLSARNILPGRLVSLARRDAMVLARVDCGVEFAVHLTMSACESLALRPGGQVWLIVKTHSCHLLDNESNTDIPGSPS